MAATLVASYASSGNQDPHVISLSGKTAGKTLFAAFNVGATPTLPSPWVEIASILGGGGGYFGKVWRLAAGDNTEAVTNLTIDLNASRALACLVWEDDVEVSSIYVSIEDRNAVDLGGGNWAIGTGVHTFTERDEAVALFLRGPSTTTWDATSYDQGFTELGDSGQSSGTDPTRIWVARKANTSLTADGVTATGVGTTFGAVCGFVAYDVAVADKLTIAEENALPANITAPEMSITGAGDTSSLGFCREFSLNVGETAHFAVDGTAVEVDIVRVGYYGGVGYRLVETIVNTPTEQGAGTTIPDSNGSITCEGWTDTASWAVPANATPGYYIGVVRSNPGPNATFMPFIVRDDARDADIMVKASDATWALAYNYYGGPASPLAGKSLYGSNGPMSGGIANRGHAMSYHRPIVTRDGIPQTYPMYAEFALVRYLERMGFDVTYSACKDWREGVGAPVLADCKIYISHGHDEYWSQGMRDKWEALRDAGKHLLFMSGNEVFWRTRFETDGDVMWCFKDTMPGPGGHVAGTALDPVSWTGTWKDERPANTVRDPEWTLTGTDFRMNGINYRTMTIASGSPESQRQFWRHTNVSTNGLIVQEVIGMEADEIRPQQPEGSRSVLASSTVNIDGNRADDNGENYTGNGDLDWGVIAQRYASGALVVGFGSVTWAWGLDNNHDLAGSATGNRANSQQQQAMLNLLRDLGALAPETPIAGLTLPTPTSLTNYGSIPGVRKARYHIQRAGIWENVDFIP